jgi:putative phage-type endonuclease
MIQGSQEWFKSRYGNASASRISDVIAKTKSGYSASRDNYLTQLVLERFGVFDEGFSSQAIEWGHEQEPFARMMYEAQTGNVVEEVGYILHPVIAKSGASPDGLVDNDGLLEIKCPNTKTHFEYLLAGKPPSKYIPQMAWQMACTGREWCDFVSYDPRAPEGLQYFEVRYNRDNEYIEMLEAEVTKFLNEVEAKYQELNEYLNNRKATNAKL